VPVQELAAGVEAAQLAATAMTGEGDPGLGNAVEAVA